MHEICIFLLNFHVYVYVKMCNIPYPIGICNQMYKF